MSKIRYRPTIARLIDEMSGRLPSEWFKLNIKQVADRAGVSRGTIYNWLNADSDDPGLWFTSYDGNTAERLKEVFSEIAGYEVDVIEKIDIADDQPCDMIRNKVSLPVSGEAHILAASAAFS